MTLNFLRSRSFCLYWLPPLAWCGVIAVLSGDLVSSQQTGVILTWLLSWLPPLSPEWFELIHGYIRKGVGHFGNYGFLYFLWFRAFRVDRGYRDGRACLWSLAACLAMATLDEGHQFMFASRGSSPQDVALDMAGAATAALAARLVWSPRLNRSRPLPEV